MASERAWFPWWVAWTAWLSGGCVSYSTTIDHEVRRGDLRVNLESAAALRPGDVSLREPPRESRVTLTVEQAPAGVTLLDANLGGGEMPPCPWAGHALIARSGGRAATAPLESHERLTLAFPTGGFEVLQKDSPRLDLLLQTPEEHLRCVSLPASDEGRRLRWEVDQHLTIGARADAEAFTSHLGPVNYLLTFPLTVGFSFGPYRVEGDVGISAAGCPDTRCPRTAPDTNGRTSAVFSFGAGFSRALFESQSWSFGAAVRYRASHLAAETFQGHEQLWMHGPVLAPYIAMVTETPSGVVGAHGFLFGFEFPVGYAFAENGDQTVTVGFSLTMLASLL
jgi:hypothetical protein